MQIWVAEVKFLQSPLKVEYRAVCVFVSNALYRHYEGRAQSDQVRYIQLITFASIWNNKCLQQLTTTSPRFIFTIQYARGLEQKRWQKFTSVNMIKKLVVDFEKLATPRSDKINKHFCFHCLVHSLILKL